MLAFINLQLISFQLHWSGGGGGDKPVVKNSQLSIKVLSTKEKENPERVERIVLKVSSPPQQPWHHLGTCYECTFGGPLYPSPAESEALPVGS